MTVRLHDGAIRLEGDCHIEQAETLVQLLQSSPECPVDLGECRQLHAALAQVLLAFRPRIIGQPSDPFLRDQVLPNLTLPPDSSDAP